MNYDTAKLRQFIKEHFGPEDLNDLLFDYFRSVHEDLTPGMTKRQHTSLLLEFCSKHNQMPNLLAAVKNMRPFFQLDDYVQRQKAPAAAPPTPAPITRDPHQIFISHAHQDAEMARRLADDLESFGCKIWMAPDNIRPGEKWAEAINRGLEESGVFLLLLSPEAVVSRWVQTETNVAIELNHEKEMQLFPLLVRDCRVPVLWRAYQYISLHDGYEPGFSKLWQSLYPPVDLPPSLFEPRDEREMPKAPQKWIHPKSGLEMMRVPSGEFLFGNDKKKLHLDEFWIAKTPVTNAEYARFVAEKKVKSPEHWRGNMPPAELANRPVVYVSWQDAKAYAAWAGMELPTEEQWEKVARGADGRKYPWGDNWRENHCNTYESGIGKTTPVGQFSPRGDTVYGCVDVSGNVWEWTDSLYQEDDVRRVLRGGSWDVAQDGARAVARDSDFPDDRLGDIGFRVMARRAPFQ